MCIELYPECGEGGDGCCERRLEIVLDYVRRAFVNRKSIPSRSVVPPIHVRRVDFQLYAVLNRIYSLTDTRTENR
jgi:hypothetical protein